MKLGIYGAGGAGREILDLALIINRQSLKWDEIFFIDDNPKWSSVHNLPIYKYNDAKEKFGSNFCISVSVGELIHRKKIFAKLEQDNISLATLIHPNAIISDSAKIGDGVIIQHGCFISCDVIIDDYSYLQPYAIISHDCVLQKGCLISGLCNLAGQVNIGQYSFLGLSAKVKGQINIGEWTIVGMGSVVLKDIPDFTVAFGNPAINYKKNTSLLVFN